LLDSEDVEINRQIYEIYLRSIEKNKKVAIVTNTLHQNVNKILMMLELQPDFIVSGEDFDKIKPFPDMYEFAIEKFNIKPEKILAFEDTDSGINAAISASLKVVDVRTGALHG